MVPYHFEDTLSTNETLQQGLHKVNECNKAGEAVGLLRLSTHSVELITLICRRGLFVINYITLTIAKYMVVELEALIRNYIVVLFDDTISQDNVIGTSLFPLCVNSTFLFGN